MSPTQTTDQAGAVRAGEELDLAAVDAWLKGQVPSLEGTPEVTQYSGGASNWTYRLKYPHRDLILRRPPSGTKAKSASVNVGLICQLRRAVNVGRDGSVRSTITNLRGKG